MAVAPTDINPATGKAYAVNPSSGVWDDNYFAKTYSSGSSTGSTGSNSVASNASDMLKMYQEANKPVVSALESTIPAIGQKYAQTGQYLQKQVGNLDTRYKSLLDSIKGLQQNDVQAVTTNTSQELGRRGISAESGLFGQTVNQAVQPVNRGYAGQISELGASQQSALDSLLNQISGLPTAQTQEEQAVRTAIAQLQAGGNTSAITNALQLYQNQQSLTEAQKERDLKTQLASVGGSDQNRYISVGNGSMVYDTATGQIVANNPKTFAGTGDGNGDGPV